MNHLVCGIPIPSEERWTSPVGMMKFRIYGKKNYVPNHQPVKCYNVVYVSGKRCVAYLQYCLKLNCLNMSQSTWSWQEHGTHMA